MRASPHAVEDARRSLEEIRALLFGALAKQPGFWLSRFEAFAEDRHLARRPFQRGNARQSAKSSAWIDGQMPYLILRVERKGL